jgi:hypothetical protein
MDDASVNNIGDRSDTRVVVVKKTKKSTNVYKEKPKVGGYA